MTEQHHAPVEQADYPVAVRVPADTEDRNRLTTFFRFFLALPHIILVGMPVAVVGALSWETETGLEMSSGGILTLVAGLGSVLAWFALVITARHPDALWRLAAWYMRWRVRATAYLTLLRDEYPPFGDDPYPAALQVSKPDAPRSRLTVFFRALLAVPHLVVLSLLSVAWAFTTAVGWAAIILTGRYPEPLYGFALGVFAWSVRVEAYMLLMRDEYPPFTLRT